MSVESVRGQGAYIVLTREDAKELFSQVGDAAVRSFAERLRKSPKHIDADLVLECGTSWDPIHRALTDGTLNRDVEDFPLDHCVLGGRRLHEGQEFEAVLIRPDIVPHVAAGMHDLKRAEFSERYMALDPAVYGKQPTEAEGDETWAMLKLIRQLFEDAGNEHAAVLFTVAR